MLKRLLSVLLALMSILLAEGTLNDPVHNKIEITAKHLNSTKTTVMATDGAVVYYQGSVIRSDRALYNKEMHLLVLDGNIEMIGYQGTKEHMAHLEIHTDTKEVTFEELFLSVRTMYGSLPRKRTKKRETIPLDRQCFPVVK